ncbi:MAG: hypothetical protein HY707_12130 [Ignavibacteriae bacterium]|nr:hypothetical protein [Ignavibacteriota bacterium]
MKYYMLVLAILVTLMATVLSAGTPPGGGKGEAGFEKLKSLAGTWKGKDQEGKPITLTYKVVSAGSSIMETLDVGENQEAMITMYHLDGDRLTMTHYCSLGNQPRMRAEKTAKDSKTLKFSFVDATNMSSPKDSHMHNLVITIKDEDHFAQEWTMWKDDKADHSATFDFARVK